jgi:hypothetical protein
MRNDSGTLGNRDHVEQAISLCIGAQDLRDTRGVLELHRLLQHLPAGVSR